MAVQRDYNRNVSTSNSSDDSNDPVPSTSSTMRTGMPTPAASASGSGSEQSQLTEKACKMCRTRKVKCDRRWPVCARCAERGDQCDFGKMVPAGVIPEMGDTGKLHGLERRLGEMEQTLENFQMKESSAPELLAEGIRAAYMEGAREPGELYQAFGIAQSVQGETSVDWRLARKALSSSLVLHLIDSFFISCCAYLPVFEPWHRRLYQIRSNIDNLTPSARVAVSGFCAMGARASPHSALLGLYVGSIDVWPTPPVVVEAGARREVACQGIHKQALDMCHRLGVVHDSKVENLETLLVMMQMLLFEEHPPRKSRTFVRLALGQLMDILDSGAFTPPERLDLVQRLGLPLVLGDALSSAYARKPPLITQHDLVRYFSIADFGQVLIPNNNNQTQMGNLTEILDRYIPRTASEGYVSHGSLVGATTTLACWLAACQRDFGYLSTYQVAPLPPNVTEIRRLWHGLDQIHAAVERIQQILVHVNYLPSGCENDGCADLHLRFDTRLDRDVSDVIHLIHVYIMDRLRSPGTTLIPHDASLLQLVDESERRVRRSLKLMAFYSQLYITSQDQHMCYHLTFQLEMLPDWTTLITQRYGERPGPQSPDLEVSELELDWFVRGLRVAAFYHPRARTRLYEVEEGRRRRRTMEVPEEAMEH